MADQDLNQQESPIGGLGGAQVAVSPKGAVTTKGATNLSEESTKTILQNMQDLISQRTSPMNQFLGGLKDATAWTAGGVNGPSEALALREAQKDKQDEQTIICVHKWQRCNLTLNRTLTFVHRSKLWLVWVVVLV